MDNTLLNQPPLFNLSRADFFNLELRGDNDKWEAFIEDMLPFKYQCFRMCHVHHSPEEMKYFLQLIEGKYMYVYKHNYNNLYSVFKSDIILNLIQKMKEALNKNLTNELNDNYVTFVNVSRVINVYIIQLLCDRGIKLNMEHILKFLKQDSEMDGNEEGLIGMFVKYDTIKKNIDTHKRIGKLFIFIFIYIDNIYLYRCSSNGKIIS